MAWQKPTDPFCTDFTAIWGLSSRMESQGPIIRGLSGLSRSCLNGILIVSCFCVVVFSFFVSSLECVLSAPTQKPLLTCTPPLSNQVRLFSSPITTTEGDIWNRLCGKQESREMNAPSGHFSSIHQLPGLYPKNRKTFICLCAQPQAGLIHALQVNASLC